MKEELNTPINKGNYTLETPEREALFEKYRGEGWETEYKVYRENWVNCAMEKTVLEYPLCVDIELSTFCNLKCPMCYTILDSYKNNVVKKFMEEDLYKRIIDEIAGKVPAIRLSLRGESTLHPKFVDFIKYAKEKKINEISFLTNCSLMTKDFFKEVMLAGADWITVSIDGLKENYEAIRKPLKYDDTLQKIKDMKLVKEEYGRHRPVIKIQSIWPAIKEDPTDFYQTFSPYVDLIAFNPLIDFNEKDENPVCLDDFSCPQIYQRLVIGSDGTALMCANSEENYCIMGDANKQSIYDIWHGEKLTEIRKLHNEKDGFKKVPHCKMCYIPRKTEDIEKAVVEDREFIIRNYVKNNKSTD